MNRELSHVFQSIVAATVSASSAIVAWLDVIQHVTSIVAAVVAIVSGAYGIAAARKALRKRP